MRIVGKALVIATAVASAGLYTYLIWDQMLLPGLAFFPFLLWWVHCASSEESPLDRNSLLILAPPLAMAPPLVYMLVFGVWAGDFQPDWAANRFLDLVGVCTVAGLGALIYQCIGDKRMTVMAQFNGMFFLWNMLGVAIFGSMMVIGEWL